MSEKIAVIGLGYVGLPAAVALGREFPGVIGFDINQKRIADLRAGRAEKEQSQFHRRPE
jgi:UDP-N-acetyl-D-galactosamine dehydrogenase